MRNEEEKSTDYLAHFSRYGIFSIACKAFTHFVIVVLQGTTLKMLRLCHHCVFMLQVSTHASLY